MTVGLGSYAAPLGFDLFDHHQEGDALDRYLLVISRSSCRPPCVVHPSISSGAAIECAGARTVTPLTDPRLLRELLAGGAWAVWVASLGGSRQDPEG